MLRPVPHHLWLAKLEEVIGLYRARLKADPSGPSLTLDEALARCRTLGLSDGEALRYLVPTPKRKGARLR